MKTLFLLRHGKADRPAGMLSDKDRPLLKHGVKEVDKMCRKMVEKGMTVELIVSSTAVRAQETAKVAAQALGFDPKKIETAEVIYGAEADELGLFLRHQSDAHNSLMLVGHNPGLEELAEMLARGYSGHLPTGGIVALRLAIQSWNDLKPGCGTAMGTLFP